VVGKLAKGLGKGGGNFGYHPRSMRGRAREVNARMLRPTQMLGAGAEGG
jgi:hypothetical protein